MRLDLTFCDLTQPTWSERIAAQFISFVSCYEFTTSGDDFMRAGRAASMGELRKSLWKYKSQLIVVLTPILLLPLPLASSGEVTHAALDRRDKRYLPAIPLQRTHTV